MVLCNRDTILSRYKLPDLSRIKFDWPCVDSIERDCYCKFPDGAEEKACPVMFYEEKINTENPGKFKWYNKGNTLTLSWNECDEPFFHKERHRSRTCGYFPLVSLIQARLIKGQFSSHISTAENREKTGKRCTQSGIMKNSKVFSPWKNRMSLSIKLPKINKQNAANYQQNEVIYMAQGKLFPLIIPLKKDDSVRFHMA